MLTTPEALTELARLERCGIELLGLDGFELQAGDGYQAPIGLILDFTNCTAPATKFTERFSQARIFVTANDAPQIRWEIVSGSTAE